MPPNTRQSSNTVAHTKPKHAALPPNTPQHVLRSHRLSTSNSVLRPRATRISKTGPARRKSTSRIGTTPSKSGRASSKLLALPREIRDLIFEALFHDSEPFAEKKKIIEDYDTSVGLRARYGLTQSYPPAILLVNRQINAEFMDAVVRCLKLHIEVKPYTDGHFSRRYPLKKCLRYWEQTPRRTRRFGTPNYCMINRIKRCWIIMDLNAYTAMWGLRFELTEKTAIRGFTGLAAIVHRIVPMMSGLEKLYIEMQCYKWPLMQQMISHLFAPESFPSPLRALVGTEVFKSVIGVPQLQHLTMTANHIAYLRIQNEIFTKRWNPVFLLRWQRTRQDALLPGDAELDYFTKIDGLCCNEYPLYRPAVLKNPL